MLTEGLCPYYRKNDTDCDMGSGYISPSDVQVIIHHCRNQFQACERFQLLCRRHHGVQPQVPQQVPSLRPGLATTAGVMPTAEPLVIPRPQPQAQPTLPEINVTWPLMGLLRHVTTGYGKTAEPVEPSVYHTITGGKERVMNQNKGWTVALAGTGINLALGVLYAWSVFKGAITESIKAGGPFTWAPASVNDPYAVCMLSFAFSAILAGRIQDKLSPRFCALIGGVLVGSGFILSSMSTSYVAWLLGFGLLAGAGMGFGYAAACPPALKWFGPSKSGLIAGIVVSGFGLAPVYIAPLAKYLLGTVGIQQAMLYFGLAFAVIVSSLAMVLQNPPAGYVPMGVATTAAGAKKAEGMGPAEMLKTSKFYILWACYFIGAGAGLMVIGFASGLAKASLGSMAFVAVAIMALGNASGRIVAGVMSDKIGRRQTLLICLLFQASLMFAGMWLTKAAVPNAVLIVLLATFMGFNYGTNLSLFPAISKDLYGLKNFGVNYGCLFTAWGVGGFVLARVSQMLVSKTGNYQGSFLLAGCLLIAGAALTFALKKGESAAAEAATPEQLKKAA